MIISCVNLLFHRQPLIGRTNPQIAVQIARRRPLHMASSRSYTGAKFRSGSAIATGTTSSCCDCIMPLYIEGLSVVDCPVPTVSVLIIEDDAFQSATSEKRTAAYCYTASIFHETDATLRLFATSSSTLRSLESRRSRALQDSYGTERQGSDLRSEAADQPEARPHTA